MLEETLQLLKLNSYYSLLDKKKFKPELKLSYNIYILFLILFNVNKPQGFIQSVRRKLCCITSHCPPSWFSHMLSIYMYGKDKVRVAAFNKKNCMAILPSIHSEIILNLFYEWTKLLFCLEVASFQHIICYAVDV